MSLQDHVQSRGHAIGQVSGWLKVRMEGCTSDVASDQPLQAHEGLNPLA